MVSKILSLTFLGVGVFVLTQIALTFGSYKLWEISLNNQNTTLTDPQSSHQQVLGVSIDNSDQNFPAFISTYRPTSPLPYDYFNLSIPKLSLDHQLVEVNSNNFDNNLTQLPGTSLPGEVGNVFITGHSALPLLSKLGLTKAPFALLTKLKVGDQVFVDAAGVKYEYDVINIKVVDPKQTDVIYPPENQGRYLTLMTCVPPGLYLKRLIVLTKLVV